MRVRVKDFNCIRDAEFVFNPGLTILQGESNGGKSSIFRAIENTIFNQAGTGNVQHGKQFYMVGIENDGHKVVFKKGKAGGVYKVDDVEYSKVGVGQLEQVAEALGIRETVLAGEKIRLNFWSQMGYPFLLDRSPGQLYKFIVDSSESESLSSVLKDIAKDIKDTEASIKANDSKLDLLQSQQRDIDAKLQSAEQVEEVCNEIIKLDSEHNALQGLITMAGGYSQAFQSLCELRMRLSNIVQLDTQQLDAAYEDYKIIQYIQEFQTKAKLLQDDKQVLISLNDNIDALSGLDSIDLSELNNIKSTIQDFQFVKGELNSERVHLSELNNQIGIINQELSEFKVCPLCGKEMCNEVETI